MSIVNATKASFNLWQIEGGKARKRKCEAHPAL
jgi:hypothetical protein